MKLPLLILGLCVALPAQADIYKHVDASGQVTYTDRPAKGAKRLDLEPAPTPQPRAYGRGADTEHKRDNVSSTPASFPRVDTEVQRKRDNVRRSVLEDELHNEEHALEDAVAAKKDGESLRMGEKASSPSYIIRMDKLETNIKLHRNNINALRKELSTIK